MNRKTIDRRTALVAPTAMLIAIAAGALFGPPGALSVLLIGIAFAWSLYPDFWRVLGRSAAAGAIAGLIVLGPAMRIAMRLVAIADAETTPSFTWEGTMFILLVAAPIVGAVLGIFLVFAGIGLGLGRLGTGLLAAGLAAAAFLMIPDVWSAIADGNPAVWVGIGSFAVTVFLHALATAVVFQRFSGMTVARPAQMVA